MDPKDKQDQEPKQKPSRELVRERGQMSEVVRLKRGSAAFQFALDMVGSLDDVDRPVLPEKPLPATRVGRSPRTQASECKVYYLNPVRA